MPFRIEPIECSRMPKWKLRPARCSDVNDSYSFRLVSVDGAKSAEPPIKAGKVDVIAFRTLPDAWRVAILGSVALNTGSFSAHPFGSLSLLNNSYSAANSGN